MNEQSYGEAFNVYNGYYSRTGTTTNLISNETLGGGRNGNNNSLGVSNLGIPRNIQLPIEFDRYPSNFSSCNNINSLIDS